MPSRVAIAGHPLHAMLVNIPIGLWIFTLTSYVVFAITGDGRWAATGYFTLAGGIAGALLAALPGLIDLLGLEEVRARRIGIFHMVLNLSIVVVQVINFFAARAGSSLSLALSALSVAALLVSGWLGGQLVHVLGVTQPSRTGATAPERERLDVRSR